jgi:hypothetical protein
MKKKAKRHVAQYPPPPGSWKRLQPQQINLLFLRTSHFHNLCFFWKLWLLLVSSILHCYWVWRWILHYSSSLVFRWLPPPPPPFRRGLGQSVSSHLSPPLPGFAVRRVVRARFFVFFFVSKNISSWFYPPPLSSVSSSYMLLLVWIPLNLLTYIFILNLLLHTFVFVVTSFITERDLPENMGDVLLT